MKKDLLYAFRQMMLNPRFTALTVFVMTAGLALFIYMFSFVHGVVHGPLPFQDSDRVVRVDVVDNGRKTTYNNNFRLHEYEFLLKGQSHFQVLEKYRSEDINIVLSDKAVTHTAHYVSPAMFEISHAKPLLGRVLTEQDMRAGGLKVAVIRETLWKSLFASDPSVIGRKILIDEQQVEIVGVMPQDYGFPISSQIWMPFSFTTNGVEFNQSTRVNIYGKLKAGVEQQQAELELVQSMKQLELQYPEENKHRSAYVHSIQTTATGNIDVLKIAMNTAVGIILLLACINTSNLLLARALEKNKETAIRMALGAPKHRIISQLLCESTLICGIAGICAVLLASFALHHTIDYLGNGLPPYWWEASVNSFSLTVALVVTVITALLTGLLPGLKLLKGDFNQVLKDGTRGAQSKSDGRNAKIIVGIEIGLSCALLLLSGAFVLQTESFRSLDYGVDYQKVLIGQVNLSEKRYENDEQRIQYFAAIKKRLLAYPEVEAVTTAMNIPSTWTWDSTFEIEGMDLGEKGRTPSEEFQVVDADFFSTMNMQLFQGMSFNVNHKLDTPYVAVISKNFANRYFKNRNPIGQHVTSLDVYSGRKYRVIGVVNDVLYGQIFDKRARSLGTVFVSTQQHPSLSQYIFVRYNSVTPPVTTFQNESFAMDPNSPLANVKTLERRIEEGKVGPDYLTKLFSVFGITSAILAFTGIFGVMSQTCLQKTQEVGIRQALGCSRSEVLGFFLKQNIVTVFSGLIIGLVIGGVLINMLLNSGFVSVSGWLLLVPLSVLFMVLFSIVYPAIGLLRSEPAQCLRYE